MSLNSDLWEIKLELKKIRKASKGFKFKYTNLPDIEKNIRPLITDKKIGYRFILKAEGDKNILLLSIFTKDEEEFHSMIIPNNVELKGMNAFQSLGSGITYFRRYLLGTAFGVITEDDVDAAKGEPQEKKKEVDHVDKLKQFIIIGRDVSTLEKYYSKWQSSMSESQKKEALEIINSVK